MSTEDSATPPEPREAASTPADTSHREEAATSADAPKAGELDRLIAELGAAAGRLRSGEVSDDEAAALVERCAELATEAGAALDREARAARAEPAPGQETLL